MCSALHGRRAKIKRWSDGRGSSRTCCMARPSTPRALSTYCARRLAGADLRSGPCWRDWRGSECPRWLLSPSETASTTRARLELGRLPGRGKNSNIKTTFFLGLPQHAGAPADTHRGRLERCPSKIRVQMLQLGLLPPLSNASRRALSQPQTCGGCLLLPPAMAGRSTRGYMACRQADPPAAVDPPTRLQLSL